MTETWFTPTVDNELIQINGYQCFRNDRQDDASDKRRGGGTAVYISLNTRCSEAQIPSSLIKPHGIEFCFLSFTEKNANQSYLFCTYLPPGLCSDTIFEFNEFVTNCFDSVLLDNPEADIFFCGDTNRYNIDFLHHRFGLCNIVNVPTFGNTTLDKFICQELLGSIFEVSLAPPLGGATNAHSIVLISKSSKESQNNFNYKKVYDLRRSHMLTFYRALASFDWPQLLNCNDVERCVEIFYEFFNIALSKVPVSFVKFTSKTKPWITPVVIDLINKRWSAFRTKNFVLYRHYKEKVKQEILKSKQLWSKRMRKTPQGIWSLVKDVRNKNTGNFVNEILAGFSDPAAAVEQINNRFSSNFVDKVTFPFLQLKSPVKPICNEYFVFNILTNLNVSKASGSDGIYPVLLRLSADVIARPLCHIFNLSFMNSLVPVMWKFAYVSPIPKCMPANIDQLRPISLLPVVSKILEKIVLKKYYSSLLRCYDDSQFAYRPKSSTVCALVTLQEIILNLLDNKNVAAVHVLTLDMSNAFDCVPHHLLLSNIANFDIPDIKPLVNWLNSYLSNRRQCVTLGCAKSISTEVTSGVPQGSILGPILFALYMSNYKPINDDVHAVKYADDMTLVIPVSKALVCDLSLVSTEIDYFTDWCIRHHMVINTTKSKAMCINFGNNCIPRVPHFDNVNVMKILGLLFNNKMKWGDHFDFIVKKASKRLYVLRILKKLLNHDELLAVFNAIIRSLMDYASPVFLNAGSVLNNNLLSICKRAFYIIHGYKVRDCEFCDMFNIKNRREHLALKLFNQALTEPDHSLNRLLPQKSAISNRLILPHVRTARMVNSFIFSCSILFNQNV